MASGPNVDWRVGLVDPTTGVPLTGLPSTVVDGGNVVEGAVADAAVTGDSAGTINAHLRGLTKTFLPVLDADTLANPTVPQVEVFPHVWNGATWDRWKDINAANGGGFNGIPAVGLTVLDTVNSQMRRTLSISSAIAGGLDGTRVPAMGSMVYAGSNLFNMKLQVTNANNTTGAGIPAAGPLLWDLVGTTNFVKQAGDGSGRTMVVGAAAAGVAPVGNPVAFGVYDGTNIQYAKASADGTNALLVAPAISGVGADGLTNVSTVKNAGGGSTPLLVLGSIFNGTTNDRARSVTSATGTTGTGLPGVGPALWDGVGATNFVKQMGDGSGRAMVVGAAAVGAVPVGNPLLLGGVDPAGGTTMNNLQVTAAATPNLRVQVYSGSTSLASGFADGATISSGNFAISANMGFNGASFDRTRHNTDVTLLASAARTTTQSPANIVTYNAGAIKVILDMTVVGTGSVTVTINEVDLASGKSILLLSGAAVTTNSTNEYTVDPVIPAVANVTAQKRLPRVINVVVTANNANSATYSVGYMLLPV